MQTESHTIFSYPSPNTPEQSETSYWPEELSHQHERIMNDQNVQENSGEKFGMQSLIIPVENKSPPLKPRFVKSPEEKGIDENIQNQAKKKEQDRKIIENMIYKSNRWLLSISSIFPLKFFPSTIIVEETRLTIIYREFFFSAQQHSIDIKDIANIFVDTIPFFATLTIVSRTFTQNAIKVTWLKKKEAVYLRRIVEGLRMFIYEKIDTSDYKTEELVKKLEALSTTKMME